MMYTSAILDHAKNPRNFREMALAPFLSAVGINSLCGDHLEVFVRCADGKITEASFIGHGCAIFTASASIMTTLITGLTPVEALNKIDDAMATIGDVPKSRIPCVNTPWTALASALEGIST